MRNPRVNVVAMGENRAGYWTERSETGAYVPTPAVLAIADELDQLAAFPRKCRGAWGAGFQEGLRDAACAIRARLGVYPVEEPEFPIGTASD